METNQPPKDRDTIVDIVSSESESECEGNKRSKTVVRSAAGRTALTVEASEEGECSSNSYRNSVKSSDDDYEDLESLTYHKFVKNGEHNTPLLEKTSLKEKRKIPHTKKAPKPPRPRKGPSLDTADLQLVKEIAEQTMKRRARVERLKALKKRRAAKSSSPSSPSSSSSSSSSNSSLFAMAITVLFFLVIIFQGFGSGQSSSLSFDDSPKSSGGAPSSGLISIEIGNNFNDVQQIANPPKKHVTRKIYGTGSSFVEQKSVSESRTLVE
ncbi:uncharacterized protein LOC111907635 [Lactuca sativa]|uniref:Uncharacterized protein n=1 Tax=Lactuca sativa TaxID=4236 RepID=A0A9R1UWD9_LACSA|nr:uncharacterized protein LOC111907635 [Lactuca sativa]XP_023759196.1 uncharacterized protein LOC111907635 [Lactuca sativa]KAJ0194489.1 hypothetical protein LSAT_V11C800424250 [Lactuca sativa]